MTLIKMLDLQRQYLAIKPEIDAVVHSVLDSTEFIQGKAVRKFEANLGTYLGARFVVGCASGTDALQVALRALGIEPGDEVITTPFTFAAATETIALLGARPVYVDIEPRTYNLDVSQIARRLTPRTKAILPVHLYGHPADMRPLLTLAREKGLKVIEDMAQAVGAKYEGRFAGTLGDIGCLSFYPTKNLGAYGDGGALVCSDEALAQRCRMICDHGSRIKYEHEILGFNSRLDSLQAAILTVKLAYLEGWTESRIRIAQRYGEGLRGLNLTLPETTANVRHVFHQYTIRLPRRESLATYLKEKGIGSAVHYPIPLHQQPAFRSFVAADDRFPEAEAASREILCLPIYPELEDSEVEAVMAAIRGFFERLPL